MSKVVLFLGAGFSQPFGIPTMSEFRFTARDSVRISAEDKALLDEIFQELARANAFLQSGRDNLEDALSFWMMGDRLRIVDEPARAPELKRIIHRICTTPGVAGKKFWERFRVFGHFLKAQPDGRLPFDLVIITTNYDVCAESALAKLGRKASLALPALPCTHGSPHVTNDLYEKGGVPVLKLHGSANWFEDGSDPSAIRVDSRIVAAGPLGDDPFELPYVCGHGYEMPGTPVIVPPTFIKPELSKALERIWRDAAAALKTADYIAFIGYSFPPTDTEMKYFIGRALAENAGLRQIYVCDTRASDVVQQLRDRVRGYGQHFSELLRPIDGSWAQVQLPLP